MLKINQLDLKKTYRSTEEELKAAKSYIYQLVEELRFRFQDEPEELAEEEDEPTTEEVIGEAVRASYSYLDVQGLDADWIRTGILRSSDGSFFFDLDNGIITTDSLSMILTDKDDQSLQTILNATAAGISASATKTEVNALGNKVSFIETDLGITAGEAHSVITQQVLNMGQVVSEHSTAITQNTEAISLKASSQELSEAVEDTKGYADSMLADFESGQFADAIGHLQDQIDGTVTSWFYDYAPNGDNYPTNEWTTIAIKNEHLGDHFYDKTTGTSYRYVKETTREGDFYTDRRENILTTRGGDELTTGIYYYWMQLSDSAVTEALRIASEAKDTADGKRRVFVTQPYPPYDVGDLWSDGKDLYRCVTAKATGVYDEDDWTDATEYRSILNEHSAELLVLDNAIQSKVSYTDYTGETIASLINQSADTIFVEAEHIELIGGNVADAINESAGDVLIDAAHIAINSEQTLSGLAGVVGQHSTSIQSNADEISSVARSVEAISDFGQFEPYKTRNGDTVTVTARLYSTEKEDITRDKPSTWYQYWIEGESGTRFLGTGYTINVDISEAGISGAEILCIYEEHEDMTLTRRNGDILTDRSGNELLGRIAV